MPASATAVADAIVAAVQALGWSGVTVFRRKVPTLPQGTDPPAVVVVVGEEGLSEYLTATQDLIKYPAAVVYFSAGGHKLEDDDTIRARRQALRQAVETQGTFASVPGFNMVQSGGKAPFNPAALPKDLNVSTQTFTVEVIEDRDGV